METTFGKIHVGSLIFQEKPDGRLLRKLNGLFDSAMCGRSNAAIQMHVNSIFKVPFTCIDEF